MGDLVQLGQGKRLSLLQCLLHLFNILTSTLCSIVLASFATTNHLDHLISPLGGLQSSTIQERLTHNTGDTLLFDSSTENT